ncbi:hypothetical protein CW304_12115 [Bacillus sp. UFRGS-B20]|nr:hypothetical protein CW304_12115 [Bacillus sp. UFRGS-B20]
MANRNVLFSQKQCLISFDAHEWQLLSKIGGPFQFQSHHIPFCIYYIDLTHLFLCCIILSN